MENFNEGPIAITNFIIKSNEIRNYVDVRSISDLGAFLDGNNHLCYFYDKNNESIMKYASIYYKKNVFLKLLSKGMKFADHEKFQDCYEQMDYKNKRILKKTLNSCLNEFDESFKPFITNFDVNSDHIIKLLKMSKCDKKYQSEWLSVIKAFDFLENPNKYIEKNMSKINSSIILKTVASWNGTKINFDFVHGSTFYLNPHTNTNALGATEANGQITIGAKGLNGERKNNVIGTIIHEFCHWAINIVFMNNFLPYHCIESNDKDRYKWVFNKTMSIISQLYLGEIFNGVSIYKVKEQESELIVRPIQVDAEYAEFNSEKQLENQKECVDLFNYHIDVVEAECKKAIVILPSLQSEGADLRYAELTDPMKAKIFDAKINFLKMKNTIGRAFKNVPKVLNEMPSDMIRNILTKNNYQLEISNGSKFNGKCLNRTFTKRRDLTNTERKFGEIATEAAKYNVFLLTDTPGAGKSFAFDDISRKLTYRYRSHWICLIKLDEEENLIVSHLELYKKDMSDEILMKMFINFQNIDNWDEDNNKFIDIIFRQFFLKERVIFLLDGIDKLSEEHQKFIIKVAKHLTKKFQVWISSRPNIINKLEKEFKIGAYKFAPYNDKQIENFITKNFSIDTQYFFSFLNQIKINNNAALKFSNSLFFENFVKCFEEQTDRLSNQEINIYIIIHELQNKFNVSNDNEARNNCQAQALITQFGKEKNFDNLGIVKNWISKKTEKTNVPQILTIPLDSDNDEGNNYVFIDRIFVDFYIIDYILPFILPEENLTSSEIIDQCIAKKIHSDLKQIKEVNAYMKSIGRSENFSEMLDEFISLN